MRVVAHGELQPYVDRVRPLLLDDEALHNLPLGVLGQLEQGVYDERVLLSVEDGAAAAGMVLRTPPWPWVVALFSGDADRFARVAGRHLARHASLPGELLGEAAAVAAVAECWAVEADAVASVAMAMRVMDCAEVVPTPPVSGAPRRIGADDLDVVVPWLVSFEEETGAISAVRSAAELRGLAERSAAEGRSPLWVWEDGGEVVSLAGIGRPTGTGERVGPVYTPPELRSRGYAGALVAHLTRDALDRGRQHVFLFTDAANPVSNRLYERLGYHHVANATRWTLRPRGPSRDAHVRGSPYMA